MREESRPAFAEQAKTIGNDNDNNKTQTTKNQADTKALQNQLDYYKSKINLNEIVQLFGYGYLKEKSSITSKQYKSESDDSKIVVTFKDGKYIYFSMTDEKDNGTIVDFLQNRGVGDLSNVLKWCKNYITSDNYTIPENQEQTKIFDKENLLKIWNKIENTDSIPEIRGIKPEILKQAIDSNAMKIDKNLNIYFALVDLDGLCGIEVRNNGEKWLIRGSKKGVWRFGAKASKAKKIVITESGIDALSYMQLHNEDINNTMYIATIGQYGHLTSEIIKAIAKANRQANWIVATDNDQAGEKMAEQIKADIKGINNTATIERKRSQNKDWNDDLNTKNMQYGENMEVEMNEKREPAVEEQAENNGNGNHKAEIKKNQAKTPLVTFAELVNKESKPTDFVIGGLPLRQLGLLIGSDGIGKSMLALQIGVSVACGISVAGGAIPKPEKTGIVTYIHCEDDTDEMVNRVKVIKNNIGNIPGTENLRIVVTEGERWPLVTTLASLNYGRGIDNELITKFVEKKNYEYLLNENMVVNLTFFKKLTWLMMQSRLVIIDPLVMFHNLNENDNGQMDYLARLLIRMAKETNCAILAVHHTGQEAIVNSRDDHQAGRGATALAAAARAVWVLRRLNKKEEEDYKNHKPFRLRKLRGSKVSRAVETDSVLLRVEDDGMLNKTVIPLNTNKGDNNGRENNPITTWR